MSDNSALPSLAEERYFMSTDAEAAAKWRMVEEYNQKKARLAALENEMRQLGETWSGMARVLKEPDAFGVEKMGQQILAYNRQSKVKIADLTPAQANWDTVVRLLSDYQQTKAEKERLAGNLKSAGVDFV